VTFYRFARGIVLGVCRVVFRVRVRGRDQVPTTGAYIVAPTHRSILDVPFTAFITTRPIRFLAKDDLFSPRWAAWIFERLGAVRVERGTADRGALRVLEATLRAGEPVAIFPEGTRESGEQIGELFDGAAYLAVKLGVPIVPVGIGGSEHILPKGKVVPRMHRVAVVVGVPVVAPVLDRGARRGTAARLTKELHDELQRCFDAANQLAGP
jgi:1-acyl-sn-glycerol-3-phosphate acyltransferase